MGVSEKVQPRAVVFDNSGTANTRLDLVKGVVERAGWLPLPFDYEGYALEELDPSIGALIIAVETENGSLLRSGAMPLIARSNELETPRAIISASSFMAKYIRSDHPDIFIPTLRQSQIPTNLSKWLIGLASQPNTD